MAAGKSASSGGYGNTVPLGNAGTHADIYGRKSEHLSVYWTAGAFLAAVFSLPHIWIKACPREISSTGILGGGTRQVNLEAREEKRREEIQVELQEREYTRKQLEDMLPGLREALYKEAAGENPSLDEVTKDLYFPSYIPGYPFEITWECENYELVQSDGKVRNEEVGENGEVVELCAVLTCYEQRWEEFFSVRICPPVLTEEERFRKLFDGCGYGKGEGLPDKGRVCASQTNREKACSLEGKNTGQQFHAFYPVSAAGACLYRFQDRDLKKEEKGKGRSSCSCHIRNLSASLSCSWGPGFR